MKSFSQRVRSIHRKSQLFPSETTNVFFAYTEEKHDLISTKDCYKLKKKQYNFKILYLLSYYFRNHSALFLAV